MNNAPIGIFDSGLGGLTILKSLRRALPAERLIYFGDTANVPYGSKSKKTVSRFSLDIAHFLEQKGVKLIIVACNTASALALSRLRKEIKVPVLGVIEPGARQALHVSRGGRIAVLGTEATVKSGAYRKQILKQSPHSRVKQIPCPLFVPFVEEGWAKKPLAELAAREYLKSAQQFHADTVILGCTHYPVLKPVIARVLGKEVNLVDSAQTLTQEVKSFLKQTEAAAEGKGSLTIYASDAPDRFKRLARNILGTHLKKVFLKKLNA